jgi:hypothetical protein
VLLFGTPRVFTMVPKTGVTPAIGNCRCDSDFSTITPFGDEMAIFCRKSETIDPGQCSHGRLISSPQLSCASIGIVARWTKSRPDKVPYLTAAASGFFEIPSYSAREVFHITLTIHQRTPSLSNWILFTPCSKGIPSGLRRES